MSNFINNIKVNKIFHLQDFNIPVANAATPHLMITGKNGSGKTTLLNAIAEFLNLLKTDSRLNYLNYREHLEFYLKQTTTDDKGEFDNQRKIKICQENIEKTFGKVEIFYSDVISISKTVQEGNFILAHYSAFRKPEMQEPKNPTKPTLSSNSDIKKNSTSQFLNFLSDLKIQEALARNEKQTKDADEIRMWFQNFEDLLRTIYEDKALVLAFNYKDYSFKINIGQKSFKFTELSDGYAAIIDIIADLILKMQGNGSELVRAYQKKGIVLIDEIETHLHLALQKTVMPMLTQLFPNIQFIVTTHSPFVLNSLNNAVAFDLESRETIDELTEYSYEALAEGYFGVKAASSYMEMSLKRLEKLIKQQEVSLSEKAELKSLISDFEKIPYSVSPTIVGAYQSLKIEYAQLISAL